MGKKHGYWVTLIEKSSPKLTCLKTIEKPVDFKQIFSDHRFESMINLSVPDGYQFKSVINSLVHLL